MNKYLDNCKYFLKCISEAAPGCTRLGNFGECSYMALQPPKRTGKYFLFLGPFWNLRRLCKNRGLLLNFQRVWWFERSSKMKWCVTCDTRVMGSLPLLQSEIRAGIEINCNIGFSVSERQHLLQAAMGKS